MGVLYVCLRVYVVCVRICVSFCVVMTIHTTYTHVLYNALQSEDIGRHAKLC